MFDADSDREATLYAVAADGFKEDVIPAIDTEGTPTHSWRIDERAVEVVGPTVFAK